jgi:hypothetical protein
MYICPVCAADSTSHSLKKIDDNLFYTKPSEATKYWDRDGIYNHYDGVLGEVVGPWSWVFDADGFDMKHMLEVDVAISLARLITTKYSHNLNYILILNPSWKVKVILKIVMPFLNEKIRSLIITQF